MRCEETKSLLDLHLDGELPLELTEKLDRHMLRCPQCAGELRSLEQTKRLLREAIAPEESSPAFRERAVARLHDQLSSHLRTAVDHEMGRQWILPFSRHEV